MNSYTMFGEGLLIVWDFCRLLCVIIYYYFENLFRIVIKPEMKSLVGEVVLITGGANGIGREIALRLAKCGAIIVSWDLDEVSNKLLVEDLKMLGCKAYSYSVDVSNRSQVESTALHVQQNVGDVSILINNAGIMPCKSFFVHTPEDLDKVFGINVFSQFWTLRAFLPKMIEKNSGHITTICSVLGLMAVRNVAPYCATKFAVNGFVEGLRDEIRGLSPEAANHIHFTTVYPSSCNTQLLNGVRLLNRFPSWFLFRPVEPEEVAEKIVDGIRRNYSHVFVPGLYQIGPFVKEFLPLKGLYSTLDFAQSFAEPISTW